MEPAKFTSDLELIAPTLRSAAPAVQGGTVPGLSEAAAVLRGRKILLLGMGSSWYAADLVARAFRARGAEVVAELASTEDLPAPSNAVAVVAISATGGSIEVLDAVRRVGAGDRLVALTNTPGSQLAELAGITVPMLAETEHSGIACRTFRHTVVMLSAMLHEATGLGWGRDELAEGMHQAAFATETLLRTRGEWLPRTAELLSAPMGSWLLAPVERLSSARQSALMLREIPRRAAYASETGDWSHVDVYLTKTQDYRALVFAGSRWDEQALEWMRSRGSTYVALGGELPGAAHTIRFPHDDQRLAAVLTEPLIAELVAAAWLATTD